MANKTGEELKNEQGTPEENNKEKGTPETNPETKGEKGNEKKPWSTKKKVGVGGAIILTVIGAGLWVKNKFFGNDDAEEKTDE